MSILLPESQQPSKAEIERVFDELENEELIRAEIEQEKWDRKAKDEEDDKKAAIIQEFTGVPMVGPERSYVLGAFDKLKTAERMELPQLAAVMRGRMRKNQSGQLHVTLAALANFLKAMGL